MEQAILLRALYSYAITLPGKGADLDYNDLLFSIDILYPALPITPAQWHPTTQIFNSLSEGLGALTHATYTVSGLTGDGVTLTHDGLSPGWTLTPGPDVDALGNGTYDLAPRAESRLPPR